MEAMKCNKDSWVKKKLGEVAKIKSGKSIKSEEIRFVSELNSYPCYGGNGIRGYVDHYLEEGDYPIIGRVGALCGNVRLASGKFYATEHALVVHINDSKMIYPKWLTNSLINLQLRQYAKGVAQPVLSASQISELCVLIPSFPEQQRIVSELDCLNGIIEKQKEQLKQLDELAQSIFYDMFGDPVENEKGWEKVTLGSFSNFKNGINFKRVDVGNPVHFLSVSDFLDKKKIKDIKEFSTVLVNEVIDDSFYLEDKDIIFVRSNGSKKLVGRSIIVYPGKYKVTYSGFCIRCRIKQNDVDYIGFLLSTPSLRNVIDNLGRGANIANLNQQLLGNLPIILPPLSLQQTFASKIEAIEHQKELIKKSIAETETLFNSRMDYYFG